MIDVQPTHVLIACQDATLGIVLADYFRSRGYVSRASQQLTDTMEQLATGGYDALVLDANLTPASALDVVPSVRDTYPLLPVIMLFDSPSRDILLRAYTLGIDDYLTKPLSIDILCCKLEAVLRRTRAALDVPTTAFQLDEYLFDSVRQTFGTQHLSARESDLLLMLCRSMNQLVDRHLILRQLWRNDDAFSSRSLTVYINHLRTYLAPTRYRIMSVHSKGYKLVSPIE